MAHYDDLPLLFFLGASGCLLEGMPELAHAYPRLHYVIQYVGQPHACTLFAACICSLFTGSNWQA